MSEESKNDAIGGDAETSVEKPAAEAGETQKNTSSGGSSKVVSSDSANHLESEKIVEKLINPDLSTITISNRPVGNEAKLSDLQGKTLNDIGLRYPFFCIRKYHTEINCICQQAW